MYIMRICFIIFISSKLCLTHKDTVPVFLIDYEAVMNNLIFDTNPFWKTSTSYFADVIHDSIKRSEVVIIFAENLLCAEDIATKDRLGTPFHHLSEALQENKVKYLPAVVEPFKLLNQIFRPQQFNVFYLSSGTKLQMFDGHFKYLYIFFQDGTNETRIETLRRHDMIMREVYFVVRQLTPGPVVAFYTGKVNPVEIEKIHFTPIRPMSKARQRGVMIETEGALFWFIGVNTAAPNRRATFNQLPTVSEETWTREKLVTRMAYTDFELAFNFSFEKDGWLLENVALLEGGEEVGRTEMAVGAPWKWAYYCGEPLVLVNTRDGSAVSIDQYKIQPFQSTLCYPGDPCYRRSTKKRWETDVQDIDDKRILRASDDNEDPGPAPSNPPDGDDPVPGPRETPDGEAKSFGKTLNCGPYFNSHILSGLFVVAICMSILIYGIIMMYNCTSNNRYDDPYGKPLIVAVDIH